MVKVHGLSDEHIKNIELILEEHGIKEPKWIDAGAVISCHGGPGAFGIVGIEK